jgi:hypothetical protein
MPSVEGPAGFNDSEMAVLEALARPIDQNRRDAFLRAVADHLGAARGEGRVHQVARQVQRDFWSPPQLNEKGYSAPFPRR